LVEEVFFDLSVFLTLNAWDTPPLSFYLSATKCEDALPRIESSLKVTGRARYTADIQIPGMLYGAILRSDRPHALIKSIDVSEALRVPGVRAIVTHEDAPKTRYNPIFNAPYPLADLVPRDKSIMRREVCYVGEPVAAVAGETMEAAEDALERIHIEYEDLPYVLDPFEALKPGAPKVRSELKYNVAEAWGASDGKPMVLEYGDVDKGFKEADEIFEDEYRTQRQNQVPLEPHCSVCYWDENERLNVWSSTQSIFMLRERLSEALDIPVTKR